MNKKLKTLKIFIDTMVYLHYKDLQDINLPSLLDVGKINIVIPIITIRELDKHKNSHPSSHIQDKARRILLKINGWKYENNEIRSNVLAEFFIPSPNIDFNKYKLNPQWNDDVLIASILYYKLSKPKENILLITQDLGLKLIAESVMIPVFMLSDEYMIQTESDPLEIENRKLKKIIEQIKNSMPKLEIFFIKDNSKDNANLRFILNPSPDIDKDKISRKLEELRYKFPKRIQSESENRPPQPEDIVRSLTHEISPEEYERYNQDIDCYLSEYENYLYKKWATRESAMLTIDFEIGIFNNGTAPAEDVDVELHFPDGFQLFDKQPSYFLQEPRPPRKPRTTNEVLFDRFKSLDIPLISTLLEPKFIMPRSFSIKRNKSYIIEDHFNRIKHGDNYILPKLFLIFDSFNLAKSFHCDYKILVANLPNAITGKLHFVIEKKIKKNDDK